jgi:aldehyde dehydrogenase (NAD+)
VIPFEDDEDAIRIANESEYGLSGMVQSGDVDRAVRVARRIRTGSVSVNGGLPIAGDLPFGGWKSSGMGREWGREGIEEYLESKVIAVGAAA